MHQEFQGLYRVGAAILFFGALLIGPGWCQGVASGEVAAAPERLSTQRHVQQGTRPPGAKAGPVAEKVVYQNTAGNQVVRFGIAHQTLADDLNTNAFSGCQLTRYQVRVNGGVFGGGGTFACDVALLDACPGPDGGGVPIAGTAAYFSGMDDDATLMHDLVVDVSAAPVAIPAGVWISVSCDSSVAGVVYGTAPTIGQSNNRYFADENGCASSVAPPAYAAFHVELFVDDSPGNTCDSGFVGYSAAGAATQILSVGAGQRGADDFTTALAPTGESCVLAGYDVYMRGTNGPFVMQLDLRLPFTDTPIAGTAFTYFGKGDGGLEIARLVIPESVNIALTGVRWISWQADKSHTGLVNNTESVIGFSEDEYFARISTSPPFFGPQIFPGPRAAVSIVIYCRGEEPRGACCGNQIAASGQPVQCQDDVSVSQCKDPLQGGHSDARWLKDRTCAENAFEPPCGTHGCCTPSNCMDTTYDACVGVIDPTSFGLRCTNDAHCPGRTCQPDGFCSPRTGVWKVGEFCDPELPKSIPNHCPFYSCQFAPGSCFCIETEVECCTGPNTNCNPNLCPFGTKCLTQFAVCTGRGGCSDIGCCDRICTQDSFCCAVAWDSACRNQAISNCGLAPGNDVCGNDSSHSLGASDIPLMLVSFIRFVGGTEANNTFATVAATDPPLCCNKYGSDVPVEGSLWFKFVMPVVAPPNAQPTTARINTCSTPGSVTATDPVLAVFSVGNPTNETSSCNSLTMLGCGDDRPGCGNGQQADLCITDLVPGRTYYIMLGGASASHLGHYHLDIEVPCPNNVASTNDTCANALTLPSVLTSTTPFSLANATQDCPDETCAYRMQSDIWYEYIAPCTGLTRFETCNPIPEGADPQTTLVVYGISNFNDTCDLDSADILGCNDDAPVNAVEHQIRPQWCKLSGLACDDSGDCQRRCSANGAECMTSADCPTNQICAVEPCVSSCGAGSSVTVPTVSGQLLKVRLGGEIGSQPSGTLTITCGIQDCNGNGIPDAEDIAAGTEVDCNQNGVPDSCESANNPSVDCNANGVPDVCEIAAGSAAPGGPFFCMVDCQPDCDLNGRIDACDIAGCPVNQQECADCNGNLVPDGCEVAGGVPLYEDDDGDGTINCLDLCSGLDDSLFAPGCVSAIPTVSGWGSAILVLLLLVGGKVYFGGLPKKGIE